MKKLLLILLLLLAACTGPTPQAIAPTFTPAPPTETATPSVNLPLIDSPQLNDFRFVDEQNGWGTTDANIVRTDDGGVTWYNATPQGVTQVGYTSFFVFDGRTAWFLLPNADYSASTLYRTSDGGETWNSLPAPFMMASLQFLDVNNGFALASLGAGAGSEGVALYKTGDGGVNWTRVFINDPTVEGSSDSLPLGGQKTGFAFLDASRGWVGGSEPVDNFIYLFATQDGGANWAATNLALPAGYENAQTGNDGPHFFSATDGILVVQLTTPSDPGLLMVAYRTTDGGQTWTPGQVLPRGRPATFSSFNEGVAWGDGQFYVTHDAGQSWGALKPNVDFGESLVSFQFASPLVGWALVNASGTDPTFYKTTDGGATWTVIIP